MIVMSTVAAGHYFKWIPHPLFSTTRILRRHITCVVVRELHNARATPTLLDRYAAGNFPLRIWYMRNEARDLKPEFLSTKNQSKPSSYQTPPSERLPTLHIPIGIFEPTNNDVSEHDYRPAN